jgi:hypothetical protein
MGVETLEPDHPRVDPVSSVERPSSRRASVRQPHSAFGTNDGSGVAGRCFPRAFEAFS